MAMKVNTILLLLLLSYVQAWGQTRIRGTVKDAADSTAIAGAIVRLEDADGKTLSFAISNSSGSFNISSDKAVDSLRVSLLGYYDVVFHKPFPQSLEVRLEQKPVKMQAATVVAQKVLMAGDTISYNVKALTNPQDRVLSDVLQRIPGLEVTRSGAVLYNGKSINRFYVNGKDVLQTDYHQVTKGLPVDDVKTVEVLTNHQPIKILQGLKESDRAALNIELDEDASGRLLGTLNAGAGGKMEKPYPIGRAGADLFVLKDRMSSMNNLTADWDGGRQEETASYDLSTSFKHENLRFLASFPDASLPFASLSAESQRSLGGKTTERFPVGKEGSMGVLFQISSAQTTVSQENRSLYKNEDSGQEIFTGGQRTTSPVEMKGALSYTKNTSKIYLDDKLTFNRDINDGYSETVGDVSGSQYVKRNRFDIENDASIGFRTAERSITLAFYTQYSSANENMLLEDYGVTQNIGSSLFIQQFSMSGISRRRGQWKLSMRPSATFDAFTRNSALAGLPDDVVPGKREGTDISRKADFGIAAGLEYGVSPFTASLDGHVSYNIIWWNSDLYRKVLADASLNLKYITGRWEWRTSFDVAKRSPDLQSIGTSVINTRYNYLWKGIDAPTYRPMQSVSTSILYREPVSGWHLSANANWSHTYDFLSARNIYGTYILSYRSDDRVESNTLSGRLEFEKGLFALNGKIKVTLDGVWAMSSFQQNSKTISYNTAAYTPAVDFSMSLARWWSTDLNANWNLSLLNQEGYSESDRSTYASVRWKNILVASKLLFLTVTTDACYNSAMDIWVFIPSVSAEWKFSNRLSLSLSADNLLNLREISYSNISPLLVETISYRVRPLSVIAKLRWQL